MAISARYRSGRRGRTCSCHSRKCCQSRTCRRPPRRARRRSRRRGPAPCLEADCTRSPAAARLGIYSSKGQRRRWSRWRRRPPQARRVPSATRVARPPRIRRGQRAQGWSRETHAATRPSRRAHRTRPVDGDGRGRTERGEAVTAPPTSGSLHAEPLFERYLLFAKPRRDGERA
eukprot:scaffold101015_cov71-Phaeocystis_antarctica.AAC.5